MARSSAAESAERGYVPSSGWLLARWAILVATPVLLGAVLWVHPHAGEDLYGSLAPVADRWYLVHVLLLPLFGLLGVCLYLLLDGYSGPVATVGRIGTAVYLVCYVAFEAIAGLATGILIREAQTLPPEQQEGVAEAVQSMVADPIVGTTALVGSAGTVVAVLSIAVLYRRSGAPLAPLALLVGVPITVVAHGGGLGDVFGTALFLISVVWLELGWKRADRQRTAQAA
ncbi:hypothetical protein ACLI4Z_10080 [Natrialbaceae archaeon A-arb3/5]